MTFNTTPAPIDEGEREALAERLYDLFTMNRIAEWDDLDAAGKSEYRAAAGDVLSAGYRRAPLEVTDEVVVKVTDRAQNSTGRSIWPSTTRAVLAAFEEMSR